MASLLRTSFTKLRPTNSSTRLISQYNKVIPSTNLLSHHTGTGFFLDENRCQFHTGSNLKEIFHIQDEADFKSKVENNKKTVIVQFHASWCGPCKLLKPRMQKSLVNFQDQVDMALVDIDEHPELAMKHNVGAVPSVIAIKDGKVVNKFVGLKDDDQIDLFIGGVAK